MKTAGEGMSVRSLPSLFVIESSRRRGQTRDKVDVVSPMDYFPLRPPGPVERRSGAMTLDMTAGEVVLAEL